MAFLEPTQQQQMVEVGKQAGDVVSLTAVGTALLGWLPPLTAAVSLVWITMRIYETYLTIREKRANARKENKST